MKQLVKPINAQESKDTEKVLAIGVLNLDSIVNK